MARTYIIKVDNEVASNQVLKDIHEQLKGNQDYIDSNIVLNDSETRQDGTKYEVHVYITDDCKEEPKILL